MYRSALIPMLVLGTLSCQAPASQTTPESGAAASQDFIGSWRLVDWTVEDGAARCTTDEGAPAGQLNYAADGHMSAHVGCPDIQVSGVAGLAPAEATGLLIRRHLSYYGTYSVDASANTVTHHVLGSVVETWPGSDQVRPYTFESPNRLVLETPDGGNRLVWMRNE